MVTQTLYINCNHAYKYQSESNEHVSFYRPYGKVAFSRVEEKRGIEGNLTDVVFYSNSHTRWYARPFDTVRIEITLVSASMLESGGESTSDESEAR